MPLTLDQAWALAGSAQAHAREAGQALGRAQGQAQAMTIALRRLAEHSARYAAVDAELRTLGQLAAALSGDNARNLSLSRFVLAARLDEVTVAASERLLAMSSGRYRLRRTDAVRHGARAAGLDLVVDDAYAGVERPVQSLSGGEMFLASLSLALGLADVVQARAGGLYLESLFIDEGFGTLDDETLDQVLRVLESLRTAKLGRNRPRKRSARPPRSRPPRSRR